MFTRPDRHVDGRIPSHRTLTPGQLYQMGNKEQPITDRCNEADTRRMSAPGQTDRNEEPPNLGHFNTRKCTLT